MANRRLVVAALLALALTACRGGAGTPDTGAPALGSHPSGLLKAEPTAQIGAGAAKATDPGAISLGGQGAASGRAVSLGDGLTIFTVAHWGREHFLVSLRDVDGQEIAVIAAGTGAYSGSYALDLGDPCDCTLAVEVDGPWAVRVEQPSPASGRPIPTRYQGQGDRATDFFQADHGMVIFHATHRGPGSFRVDLLDATGERIDRLALGEGDFDGGQTVEVDRGVYLLQVEAQGAWTVDVQTP